MVDLPTSQAAQQRVPPARHRGPGRPPASSTPGGSARPPGGARPSPSSQSQDQPGRLGRSARRGSCPRTRRRIPLASIRSHSAAGLPDGLRGAAALVPAGRSPRDLALSARKATHPRRRLLDQSRSRGRSNDAVDDQARRAPATRSFLSPRWRCATRSSHVPGSSARMTCNWSASAKAARVPEDHQLGEQLAQEQHLPGLGARPDHVDYPVHAHGILLVWRPDPDVGRDRAAVWQVISLSAYAQVRPGPDLRPVPVTARRALPPFAYLAQPRHGLDPLAQRGHALANTRCRSARAHPARRPTPSSSVSHAWAPAATRTRGRRPARSGTATTNVV